MAIDIPSNDPSSDTADWAHLHVQPTDMRLDPNRITAALERLHDLDTTVECLLVAPAHTDSIEYYVGVQHDLDRLERILRGLFPDEYELTHESPDPQATFLQDEQDDGASEQPAAVEFYGRGERRGDWQTRLRPAFTDDELAPLPLAHVAEVMAAHDGSVAYQALFHPKPAWTAEADVRRQRLEEHRDTTSQRWFTELFGDLEPPEDERDIDPTHRERLDSIAEKDTRRSFDVNARAVAMGPDATRTVEDLAGAFSPVDRSFYRVEPRIRTEEDAIEARSKLRTRTFDRQPPVRRRLAQQLPLTANRSPCIVTDQSTLPNFTLLSGDALPAESSRALTTTPGEQTSLSRPPEELLAMYRGPGLTLGQPLTQDGTTDDDPVALPPSLQPMHVAWFGKTGSGKSTALSNAILANHTASDGASILIDPKGDGMPREYLRAHYAMYGHLENVYYFTCGEFLPALSFFDIRDQLQEGIHRTTAVEDVVDHYIELLVAIMGRDQFHSAVRSPDIIRYLVKALFDPVHGADAFSHRQLQHTARRMHETQDAPPVTDSDLEAMLSGVASNSKRSFDELMQGVANRIEKIPLDDRLGQLFNHVPDDGATDEPAGADSMADDRTEDPQFDLRRILDEDAIVIIDTSGLRTESRRAVTLIVLSKLWTALRRRAGDTDEGGEAPLVNLYLEEAANIGTTGLMTDLLSQSRGFGLSVTLAMQFPGQLRTSDQEAYAEVLNNVSTIITGNVAVDRDLALRLATEDMAPDEVGNRLRALKRGEWFVSLPAPFGHEEPRPFVLESTPLPAGHPEGDEPLTDVEEAGFKTAFDALVDRTRRDYGLAITGAQQAAHPEADAGGHELQGMGGRPLDSALPYTKRLPQCVEYDADRFALVCGECGNRYDRDATGMCHAITCCHRLADVDRDDVPIAKVNLKLSPREVAENDYSINQLLFLQAVYTAHQGGYDPELEYDIVYDSMIRLQEYVGIDADGVQTLLDDGLLVQDRTHPHRLYTVTPEGRDEVAISHREGVAYGDRKGDLSESSYHVAMVEVGARYLQQKYVEDPDSPVVEVVKYPERDDARLDLAGLDDDGGVHVTLEAERSNHDTLRAVPNDFDKMAACEPEVAIWLVPNRQGAHDVIDALHDPPEGAPRVEKTYSENTPPSKINIDQPGLTEIQTFVSMRNSLEEGRR